MPPAIARNLRRLGWSDATPIQDAAHLPVRQGRDVLGLARTGSGKTGAFLLPIAAALLAAPKSGAGRRGATGHARSARRGRQEKERPAPPPVRVMVLCPTRELAMQVAQDAERLLNGTHIAVACLHGKVAIGPQRTRLAEGVDLLVATPGRVHELLGLEALDLGSLQTVVLDEADRMLDMGLGQQVTEILAATPADRQTLLFTATMPPKVAALAESILREPVRLDVDPSGTLVGHVEQRAYAVEDELKVPLLLSRLLGEDHLRGQRSDSAGKRPQAGDRTPGPHGIAGEPGSAPQGVLIFCRTRRRAHWIGAALERHGLRVGYLHGDRSHTQRVKALEAFRARRSHVLLATDVAARGLHVESVEMVVQYDLPLDPAEYVHRLGRAAHGLEGRGGAGLAIAFVAPDEQSLWQAIARLCEAPRSLLPLPPEVAAQRSPRRRGRSTGGSPQGEEARSGAPTNPSRSNAGRRGEGRPQRTSRAAPKATPSAGLGAGPGAGRSGRESRLAGGEQRRRTARSKPIAPGQRPGGGVRRSNRN